jgi:hypothetical protein
LHGDIPSIAKPNELLRSIPVNPIILPILNDGEKKGRNIENAQLTLSKSKTLQDIKINKHILPIDVQEREIKQRRNPNQSMLRKSFEKCNAFSKEKSFSNLVELDKVIKEEDEEKCSRQFISIKIIANENKDSASISLQKNNSRRNISGKNLKGKNKIRRDYCLSAIRNESIDIYEEKIDKIQGKMCNEQLQQSIVNFFKDFSEFNISTNKIIKKRSEMHIRGVDPEIFKRGMKKIGNQKSRLSLIEYQSLLVAYSLRMNMQKNI